MKTRWRKKGDLHYKKIEFVTFLRHRLYLKLVKGIFFLRCIKPEFIKL